MDGFRPPFIIEMLEFEGNRPFPKGRLAAPADTLEDAKIRGKREISSSGLTPRPLGFRILDVTEQEAFRWKLGDENSELR